MFDAATAPPRPAATTPAWLMRFLAAVLALALLAGGLSLWAAHTIGDAAQTIGRDAEPSVALALRMAATLADMDAAALVDSLTDNGAATGTSRRFGEGVGQLASDVVAASQNITYGEAEAAPLRALQRALALYEAAVTEARGAGSAGDLWITSRRVQWASRVNREMARPPAEALAAANADELEQRYAAYRATALLYGGAAFAAFAVLVAVLVIVQVWLARRVRRLVNPLLATATVIAGAAGLWFATAVLTERADLRAAKLDAYDSLHVLFQAKGAVNALRAEMSLWLLDPSVRPRAQERMDATAALLLGTDLSKPAAVQALQADLDKALALERRGLAADALAQAPHPGGLLGTEMDNVTFGAPEREAATDSIAWLARAESAIRAVQAQGGRQDHALVVTRWLDEAPGGPADDFAKLQAALDRTIAVNQGEFDRRVTSALGTARLMPAVTSGALVLAALLAAGGLWLRLREYR